MRTLFVATILTAMAGCHRAPAQTAKCTSPATASPTSTTRATPSELDDEAPEEAPRQALGGGPGEPTFACRRINDPGATVTVTFGSPYSAIDVATWLIGSSCRTVVVPVHVRSRQSSRAFHTAARAQDLPRVLNEVLAELELVAVTEDRVTVFVDTRGGAGERLARGQPDLIVSPLPPPAAPESEPAPEPKPGPTGELDQYVTRIADDEYEIARAGLDLVLADEVAFLRGARIVPSQRRGTLRGFKLYAIRPSSFFAAMGLQNGDAVVAINKAELTSIDKTIEALAALRGATQITLAIERRGQALLIKYTIR